MVVVAEGARADAALTAGFCIASSSLGGSVERRSRWAGAVVISAARSGVPIWRPVPFIAAGTIPAPVAVISAAVAINSAARISTSIVVVAVIKRVAPGAVPLVIMNYD